MNFTQILNVNRSVVSTIVAHVLFARFRTVEHIVIEGWWLDNDVTWWVITGIIFTKSLMTLPPWQASHALNFEWYFQASTNGIPHNPVTEKYCPCLKEKKAIKHVVPLKCLNQDLFNSFKLHKAYCTKGHSPAKKKFLMSVWLPWKNL